MKKLAADYLGSKQAPFEATRLMHVLGCRHLSLRARRGHVSGSDGLVVPPQPDNSQDELVGNLLRSALLNHTSGSPLRDDGCAILDGLTKGDHWRVCLDSVDGAYALAYLLLDYSRYRLQIMPSDVSASALLVRSVEEGACRLLNDWLKPREVLRTVPSDHDLVSRLFGLAWYDFVFVPNAQFTSASKVVRAHKPPFLPALVGSAPSLGGLRLPNLCL
jgi:hypothetical protein